MEDRLFGRRYRVTEKIGAGGMAEVFKAVDEVLGRTVAVKVLHPRYAADPSFTSRFRQEAQAAANLQSPYIVNMYDWGQDGDTYYIVMEYVRGTDLKTIIQDRGAIESRNVADVGAQVCAALNVAHGYDIIHRDIKPHNIMVQPDGTVKVMDFGIARAGNTTMTQTGSVLGTAHYVSPEQAQGKPLTAASDLYSLGVVLYEASTGRLPFDAETPVAVALKQVNDQPRAPRSINPNIDPGLEAVILKAMAKDPAQRYDSAADMRRDLKAIASGGTPAAAVAAAGMGAAAAAAAGGVAAHADGTAVMPAVGGETYGRYGTNQPRQGAPRRGGARKVWPWVLLGVAMIVAGLGVAWAMGLLTNSALVPDVTGKTRAQAQSLLEKDGFVLGETTQANDPKVAKGQIVSQSPSGNTPAKKGAAVSIVISKGPELVAVPDVTGKPESEALQLLRDAGFDPQSAGSEYNKDFAPGTVFKQSPTPDDGEQPKGSVVSYYISLGTETVVVPNVVGKPESDANAALTAAGFVPKTKKTYSDAVAKGNVISQSPSADGKADKGSTVTITVSQGPETIPVPDVIGQTASAAETALVNAGFTVSKSYEPHSNSGLVLEMNPTPPATAKRGTEIQILIDGPSQ